MMDTAVSVDLVSPYGGRLVDLFVAEEMRAERLAYASRLRSLQLTQRAVCDLELLSTGGFSPLSGFMGEADYRRVVAEMRLDDGTLFPIPVTLPLPADAPVSVGDTVALRDERNNLLAIMHVSEKYPWDMREAALNVFGTLDVRHPIVAEMHRWGIWNIAGQIEMLALPPHHDFTALRRTPREVRARLMAMGRRHVVAFQTRNPMHRAHEELTRRAAEAIDGVLLLHPSVGMTKPGDVDHYTRVRTYKALTERYYPPDRVLLSLLPLAMRMGGPREAVWHAIIRRNHGASHFIVGRDHAGPGSDSTGKPFYGAYDAQNLVRQHEAELGITMLSFSEMVYLPDEDRYEEEARLSAGTRTARLSGTQVRDEFLNRGRMLPEWFTRPEVARVLAESYPPRHRQGVCLWFTGLSGAGKSTIADVLTTMLPEYGRQVTLLDGDVVRTHLSKGLGFSAEDRDINIRRIGFVASEVVRHGGLVICAAISPYRATRADVRHLIGVEQFAEIYVSTPIEVCEQRDVKGMYAKARRGEITGFTGVDDPYEPPLDPEITLDTVSHTPYENAWRIIEWLLAQGFIEG
jgi:sulfate adenylyltransferase